MLAVSLSLTHAPQPLHYMLDGGPGFPPDKHDADARAGLPEEDMASESRVDVSGVRRHRRDSWVCPFFVVSWSLDGGRAICSRRACESRGACQPMPEKRRSVLGVVTIICFQTEEQGGTMFVALCFIAARPGRAVPARHTSFHPALTCGPSGPGRHV